MVMVRVSFWERLAHSYPRALFYHGNYCGPGNRGGEPTDALDAACLLHDREYEGTLRLSLRERLGRQIRADLRFACRAARIAASPATSRILRAKALLASLYFRRRVALLRALRQATGD